MTDVKDNALSSFPGMRWSVGAEDGHGIPKGTMCTLAEVELTPPRSGNA